MQVTRKQLLDNGWDYGRPPLPPVKKGHKDDSRLYWRPGVDKYNAEHCQMAVEGVHYFRTKQGVDTFLEEYGGDRRAGLKARVVFDDSELPDCGESSQSLNRTSSVVSGGDSDASISSPSRSLSSASSSASCAASDSDFDMTQSDTSSVHDHSEEEERRLGDDGNAEEGCCTITKQVQRKTQSSKTSIEWDWGKELGMVELKGENGEDLDKDLQAAAVLLTKIHLVASLGGAKLPVKKGKAKAKKAVTVAKGKKALPSLKSASRKVSTTMMTTTTTITTTTSSTTGRKASQSRVTSPPASSSSKSSKAPCTAPSLTVRPPLRKASSTVAVSKVKKPQQKVVAKRQPSTCVKAVPRTKLRCEEKKKTEREVVQKLTLAIEKQDKEALLGDGDARIEQQSAAQGIIRRAFACASAALLPSGWLSRLVLKGGGAEQVKNVSRLRDEGDATMEVVGNEDEDAKGATGVETQTRQDESVGGRVRLTRSTCSARKLTADS